MISEGGYKELSDKTNEFFFGNYIRGKVRKPNIWKTIGKLKPTRLRQ